MPLARYFLFVGGVVLALLFISDLYLPKSPAAKRMDADLPAIPIRIHSDHKWPARVVYDTSLPTILPAAPTQVAVADTGATVPPKITDLSAKAATREAFALVQPKKPIKPQRKRTIASQRAVPLFLVAQRPQFGWFGRTTW